jgi:biotin-[acetyl-CoA-carboxylase] ligase BirA-like protein
MVSHLPDVERFDSIDSTSLAARRGIRADGPPPHDRPRLLVAAVQTGGVGRLARPWHSPAGGLWCTLAWTPVLNPLPGSARLPNLLGLRTGLACVRALEAIVRRRETEPSARVTLKWPNDVLVNGRKAVGVLTEVVSSSHAAPDSARWCVLVGVGLNANFDLAELPEELHARATTLRHELGRDIDLDAARDELAAQLLAALSGDEPDHAVIEAIRSRLHVPLATDPPARITLADGTSFEASIDSLRDDGSLRVRTDRGPRDLPPGSEIAFS